MKALSTAIAALSLAVIAAAQFMPPVDPCKQSLERLGDIPYSDWDDYEIGVAQDKGSDTYYEVLAGCCASNLQKGEGYEPFI